MLDGGVCEFDMPDELRGVAKRHQQHIGELVSKLESLGINDETIERSVDQLIQSYRAELLEAIKALKVRDHA